MTPAGVRKAPLESRMNSSTFNSLSSWEIALLMACREMNSLLAALTKLRVSATERKYRSCRSSMKHTPPFCDYIITHKNWKFNHLLQGCNLLLQSRQILFAFLIAKRMI